MFKEISEPLNRHEQGNRVSRVRALVERLNGPWHKHANQAFLIFLLVHWSEHLVQAWQVYMLQWPRPHSHGSLGQLVPWLNTSEWLHYGYAVIILAGLILLRPGYIGRARLWWNLALAIQIWHFFEHFILLGQALLRQNLFDASVPTSLLQVMIPRVELHLVYNALVFIPLAIGMYDHMRTGSQDGALLRCSCGRLPAQAAQRVFS